MDLRFPILPISDEQFVLTIEQLVSVLSDAARSTFQWTLIDGENNSSCRVAELRSNALLAAVLQEGSELFRTASLHFSISGHAVSITLNRDLGGETKIILTVDDQLKSNSEHKSNLIIEFRKAFQPYSRSNVLKNYHPILHDFYERLNATTVQLIELNGKIIRENDVLRRDLEARASADKERLDAGFHERQRALEAEYMVKAQELKEHEKALDERKKLLDDRDNTHARRQNQEVFNSKLQNYHASFKLTADTSKKRIPIHCGFIAGLILLAVLAITNTWTALQAQQGIPFWWQPLRAIGYTAGFIGLLIYYVRWQDRWAQAHADEEFRLTRLELDNVRASWLVEVLLEWQRESKGEVPPELIQKLGAGLFEQFSPGPGATHPVEDMVAALLGNSSNLHLDFPGGKAVLDRKGLDRTRAAGA